MRDYLKESQETLGSRRPLAELLAENRMALLGTLVKFLGNSDIYRRKYAAFCLGQIGDESALPALQAAFNREEEGGAKQAMGAALACIRKFPASSGSTEAQRCQFVEEVYKKDLPDYVTNFWKQENEENGKKVGAPQAIAKASSGGCFTLVVVVLVLAVIGGIVAYAGELQSAGYYFHYRAVDSGTCKTDYNRSHSILVSSIAVATEQTGRRYRAHLASLLGS